MPGWGSARPARQHDGGEFHGGHFRGHYGDAFFSGDLFRSGGGLDGGRHAGDLERKGLDRAHGEVFGHREDHLPQSRRQSLLQQYH